MKSILLAAGVAFFMAYGWVPTPAQAAGCLKGAAVGAVAGHVAGHHGTLGAGAGCAVGHHEAKKATREKAQNQQPNGTGAASSNSASSNSGH